MATELPAQALPVNAGVDPPSVACEALASDPTGPSHDLYCIDLVPIPDLPSASGRVRLEHVPSPFGTAVTVDGVHRYHLSVEVQGLPEPAAVGEYSRYVAWATTPQLWPVVRLGELDGAGRVGAEVAYNRLLVIVSAEDDRAREEWAGRVVLRGLSPSNRIRPLDDPILLLGAGTPAAAAPSGSTDRGEPPHLHGGRQPPDGQPSLDDSASSPDLGWVPPPMDPDRFMPPGMMALRPNVAPYLPDGGADLPQVAAREVVSLHDGDTLELTAGLVRRTIEGRTITMYAFNGQQPGPLLVVEQGARIDLDFRNELDHPTAIHWHGIRLENRFDGVPFLTQDPVPPGGSFTYRINFPDPGIYWYHPHLREDTQQDLGLYGNIVVTPAQPNFFGPVHRDEVLILDDLLLATSGLVPFGAESPTHATMGRFGNVLLVNGSPDYRVEARPGEVVRFHMTNAANTRTFNVSLEGAPLKVVGSDLGRFEREEWVESVVIAPGERYIVDARFGETGEQAITNRVQALDHVAGTFLEQIDTLGFVAVTGSPREDDPAAEFARLRENHDVVAELDPLRSHLDRAPDHQLILTMEARGLPFPVHAMMRGDSAYFHPVEWSGTMEEMNWVTTGREIDWILQDPATGERNVDIQWRFRVGDLVKIRIHNDRNSLHAMHHPIHAHGQRFLVLARNGVENLNLVWKDTALVPVGQTLDLLLELSNPGEWMLHCHIAEHLEAGMHLVFRVDP
jgi:suppressor of ftsI